MNRFKITPSPPDILKWHPTIWAPTFKIYYNQGQGDANE